LAFNLNMSKIGKPLSRFLDPLLSRDNECMDVTRDKKKTALIFVHNNIGCCWIKLPADQKLLFSKMHALLL